MRSPEPNGLQANRIAEEHLAAGDGGGALRWLEKASGKNAQSERLDLMDRAYELLGHRDGQIRIRKENYWRTPSLHTYRALEAVLPPDERNALRARACEDASKEQHLPAAAELLFALGDPANR